MQRMPSATHRSAPRLLQFILFATWGESTPLSAVLLRYFNGVEPAQRLADQYGRRQIAALLEGSFPPRTRGSSGFRRMRESRSLSARVPANRTPSRNRRAGCGCATEQSGAVSALAPSAKTTLRRLFIRPS